MNTNQFYKKDPIIESLMPMYKEAIEKKLWFHCKYQDLWFSPRQLFQANKSGRFIWGPQNWELHPFSTIIERHCSEMEAMIESVSNYIIESKIPFTINDLVL